MVTTATTEQFARKILSIFVARGCGPGDTAEMNHFIEAWTAGRLNDERFCRVWISQFSRGELRWLQTATIFVLPTRVL